MGEMMMGSGVERDGAVAFAGRGAPGTPGRCRGRCGWPPGRCCMPGAPLGRTSCDGPTLIDRAVCIGCIFGPIDGTAGLMSGGGFAFFLRKLNPSKLAT